MSSLPTPSQTLEPEEVYKHGYVSPVITWGLIALAILLTGGAVGCGIGAAEKPEYTVSLAVGAAGLGVAVIGIILQLSLWTVGGLELFPKDSNKMLRTDNALRELRKLRVE